MKIHKYEKAFLILSAGILVIFLGSSFYAAAGMGIMLPTREGELEVSEVRKTPPFDHPGVREVAPGVYEVVVIGQAWSFTPGEIRIPAGAEVTFIATSADVLHGFNVEGTRVNVMLIPGQVSKVTHRFKEPGEHLLICHEYCGLGHHMMAGKVIVE
jgi:cytochrome c oxidase subunit 2